MNKVIVITGGSKGIGKAIVHKFAENGFDVITCARNEKDLLKLKQEVEQKNDGITVYTKKVDMAVKAEVFAFYDFIQAIHKPIEILINNAGIFLPGEIANEPEGNLERMINTNLYSAYYLTRALLPSMLQVKRGDIFNICSVASIMPYANGGSYSISKYAIYGMTKVLREEMKPHGIRVTAVLPGATRTSSWDGVDLPASRFIKSEDVADAIYGVHRLSSHAVVEEILIRPQKGDI